MVAFPWRIGLERRYKTKPRERVESEECCFDYYRSSSTFMIFYNNDEVDDVVISSSAFEALLREK